MPVTPKQIANLKPAKKGEVRNPLGGKTHNSLEVKLKRLTNEELAEIGGILLRGDVEGLRKMSKAQKGVPVIKAWTAKIIITSYDKGDHGPWETVLNRFAGRIPQPIQHTGANGGPMTFAQYAQLSSENPKTKEVVEVKSDGD